MILDTSKNKEFKPLEKKAIKGLLAKHGLDIGVNVIRNEGLKWRENVACFSVMHPDTVFVCADQPNICRLIPHIAHKLKHREQYKRMGKVRYLMLMNPLWRKWTLEPECYAEEDRLNLEMQ